MSNEIFGNSDEKHEIGSIAIATYKGMECNVKIIREATKKEYKEYLKRMNFDDPPFYDRYFYMGIGD